jgi:hypothetical protein
MDYQLTFTYIARMIMREAGESNKSWQKRKRSARVEYHKTERQRFRACQRSGLTYCPHGLDFIENYVQFSR